MELSLSNGLILAVDKVLRDPYDKTRYLLFRHGIEIGRWYKHDLNEHDLDQLKKVLR